MTEEQNTLQPDITLEELGKPLQDATARAGWTSLQPVQARAIPQLLAGKSMMIQARTGSGKTGAFLLPMLELLDPKKDACQALILVPTRELAQQVSSQVELLCSDAGFRSVSVYGGVSYRPQIDAFKQGAQIVIGTPGRILDHLLKGTLSLKKLKMLIFDEADRMLSMGFYQDMKKLQKHVPKKHVQGCMFSATFPNYVLHTAHEFINEPQFISLSKEQVYVAETEHVFYVVPDMDKDRSLIRIIEMENPAQAIVFCNTKSEVHYVATVLKKFGYDADELTSDLTQKARERVLNRTRNGSLRFLVATDVASRGIDIPQLSHVVLYEPPEDFEAYIHRAGRTGRAGAAGKAISLATEAERFVLTRIIKRYELDMQQVPLPTDEDVEKVVRERVIALLEAKLRERDSLKTERSKRFISLGRELAENEDELPAIAMLLDDYYQQVLHAPPPSPETEKPDSDDDREDSRDSNRKRRPRKGRRR